MISYVHDRNGVSAVHPHPGMITWIVGAEWTAGRSVKRISIMDKSFAPSDASNIYFYRFENTGVGKSCGENRGRASAQCVDTEKMGRYLDNLCSSWYKLDGETCSHRYTCLMSGATYEMNISIGEQVLPLQRCQYLA